MKGILTSYTTSEDYELELYYDIYSDVGDSSRIPRKLFTLKDTARIKFVIDDWTVNYLSHHGWVVFLQDGRIFIPAEEMQKAFTEAGLMR